MADAYANNLTNKDPVKFWQSIKKDNSSKLTKYADTINGVTGEQNIYEMWKDHFQMLYNSVPYDNDAVNFKNVLATFTDSKLSVCLAEVVVAINKLIVGKSPGPGGIHSESYIHGRLRFATHICIMLNLFFVHSYIPDRFMDTTIVPLVKCRGKDLANISNYRAITLSNSITKVLEFVFLDHIDDKMSTIDSQFGFKAGLST